MNKKKFLFPLGLFLVATLQWSACSQQQASHATLYRDDFGVPHIYAETEEAAAYVHGYAQAEDRLEQILKHYRWAEGTLAEVLGKRYLESDYRSRVWRHAEISRKKYLEVPAHTRAVMEAFIAGLKAYMKEHPDRVPDWAPEIHPWHILALGRAFIWGWPEGEAWDDLNRKKPVPKVKTRGSNQWALAGSRTASGKPILLIDPHLGWETSGKWTEVRLHAGDLNMAGMVIPGLPYIALGHNKYVAWAATTGGPDCGDIYEIETDPAHPLRYRYDDAWRTISVDSVRLGYKDGDRIKYVTRRIERSHHGPIVRRAGNKAYAMALPYENEVLLIETSARLCKAKSVFDIRDALAMQQFLPQNIMAADIHGNIFYERTGRVPIRPAGYDFSYPVPGNTSKTEWQGIHPTKDLVHILNPKTGYMQNCNISPGTMMHTGAPQAADYPDYIFNDRQNRSNPRGRRAVALLRTARKVDIATAMKIAFDTTVDGTEIIPWQQALKQAFEAHSSGRFSSLQEAEALLVNWNRSVLANNEAAVLFKVWRQQIKQSKALTFAQVAGAKAHLSRRQQRALLLALEKAVAKMQQVYGSIRVPWGKTLRLRRGDKDLPLSGAGLGSIGMSTLRNIWARNIDKHGVSVAEGGQSCPMLVHLTDPIESYSILPYGISDDPKSPHHIDQMGLFSQMQMKPTWFNRQALHGHITSEREFKVTLPAAESASN